MKPIMNQLICTLILFLGFVIPAQGQSQWYQMGVDLGGEAVMDNFGYATDLSADGLTIVIGGKENDDNGLNSGHVRVFNWNGTSWVQKGNDINGEASGDYFGYSVSINDDGDCFAVSSPWNDNINGIEVGNVRVFNWDGNGWVQKGPSINGINNMASSGGSSLAMNGTGDIIAIGDPNNYTNGSYSGQIRVFKWTGNFWEQLGNSINGEVAGGLAGEAVSLSNDGFTLAFGAINEANLAGQAKVFVWNGISWVQKGGTIVGEEPTDRSGSDICLSADGNILAIGAYAYHQYTGHTRIFKWNGNVWEQMGSSIIGEDWGDTGGTAISMSHNGKTIAIGATLNDGNGAVSGHTRVFKWNVNDWMQIGQDIDGENEFDFSGWDVNLSSNGKILATSAIQSSGNIIRPGQVRIFEYFSDEATACPVFVYPTITHDLTYLSLDDSGTIALSIVDVNGKIVANLELENTNEIDLSTYQAGMYYLHLSVDCGESVIKVIKY